MTFSRSFFAAVAFILVSTGSAFASAEGWQGHYAGASQLSRGSGMLGQYNTQITIALTSETIEEFRYHVEVTMAAQSPGPFFSRTYKFDPVLSKTNANQKFMHATVYVDRPGGEYWPSQPCIGEYSICPVQSITMSLMGLSTVQGYIVDELLSMPGDVVHFSASAE